MRPLMLLAGLALILLGMGPAPVSAQAGPPALERFVLSGVIIFDDGEGVAWLQEPTLTGNRVVTRRQGDSVGPWRLARILDNRVELEGPGGTVVVPLYNNGGGAGTVTAAAAPGPGRPQPATATAGPAEGPEAPSAAAVDRASWQGARGRARAEARQARGERQAGAAQGRRQRERQDAAGSSRQPTVADGARPSPSGSGVISFPVGDPRRQQNLQELFGAR